MSHNKTLFKDWKEARRKRAFLDYVYEREPVRSDRPHRWDQIYLSEIRYADYGSAANPQFLVTVKFVYEQRPDPFSEYRSGFEVRTIRRCSRIEVFANAGVSVLTRAYHLTYLDDDGRPEVELPRNGLSLLRRIRVEGRHSAASQSLPPFGTVEDARAQAKENAVENAQVLAAAEWPVAPRGDSTISSKCPHGDGWASIDLRPEQRGQYQAEVFDGLHGPPECTGYGGLIACPLAHAREGRKPSGHWVSRRRGPEQRPGVALGGEQVVITDPPVESPGKLRLSSLYGSEYRKCAARATRRWAGGAVSTSSRPHGTTTCTISASNFSRRITRCFRANSWLAKLSLLEQFPGVSHGAPRMGNPFQMVQLSPWPSGNKMLRSGHPSVTANTSIGKRIGSISPSG